MYAAISSVDRLQAEPESLRKWREEQRERLEQLGNLSKDVDVLLRCIETFNLWLTDILLYCFSDANSRKQEVEWKEKAKLELEEWHTRQNEQLEKTKVNNRYTLFEQLKSRSEAFLSFAVWLQKQ